jgi:thiosulfate dehydrogenase (quinone) large subunit
MLHLIRISPIPISKDPNSIALAGLRIMVGIFFTIFGEYKVFGTQFVRGGFQTYVEGFIRGGAYPFMIPVLKGVLEHCAVPMAVAVAYGEFLIGLSLVIGVLSRLASIFGIALMTAMWLSGGYPGEHAAFWMYWGASLNWSVFTLCFVVLALSRPEEVWSLRHIGHRCRKASSPQIGPPTWVP